MSNNDNKVSRRGFISGVLPVCAVSCMACQTLFASGSETRDEVKTVHKFEEEFPQTYEKSYRNRFKFYIQRMKWFSEQIGEEKLLTMLKQSTDDLIKIPDTIDPEHTFENRKKSMTKPDAYKNQLTFEVVEDTDKVFAFNVRECIWAKSFRDQDAGDIGYASVCHGDYKRARTYHPQMHLERTQTLMQGDAFCNFKWIWKD